LNLSDKTLTHLNIHYPDIISEIGSLEPLSCIRMEAKHREGKQTVYHQQIESIYLILLKDINLNFIVDYWLREIYL